MHELNEPEYKELDKELLKGYIDFCSSFNHDGRGVLKLLVDVMNSCDKGEVRLFTNTMVELGNFLNDNDLGAFCSNREEFNLKYDCGKYGIHSYFKEVDREYNTDLASRYIKACIDLD